MGGLEIGGVCKQDNSFWCPLSTDDCQRIPKVCVLLTSATAGAQTLARIGLVYEIKDGKMVLLKKPSFR